MFKVIGRVSGIRNSSRRWRGVRVVSHVQGDRAGEWRQSLFKVMERGEGRQSCSR